MHLLLATQRGTELPMSRPVVACIELTLALRNMVIGIQRTRIYAARRIGLRDLTLTIAETGPDFWQWDTAAVTDARDRSTLHGLADGTVSSAQVDDGFSLIPWGGTRLVVTDLQLVSRTDGLFAWQGTYNGARCETAPVAFDNLIGGERV